MSCLHIWNCKSFVLDALVLYEVVDGHTCTYKVVLKKNRLVIINSIKLIIKNQPNN